MRWPYYMFKYKNVVGTFKILKNELFLYVAYKECFFIATV